MNLLVTGRPGSGKTYLIRRILPYTNATHLAIDQHQSWGEITYRIGRTNGPIIVEGCRPAQHTVEALGPHVRLLVTADDRTIEARLSSRGWSSPRISKALGETYDDSGIIVESDDHAMVLAALDTPGG